MRLCSQLIFIFLLALYPTLSRSAETYSCRDSAGQLHFADKPERLPQDCRGNAKIIHPEKLENINIVPSPKGSKKSNTEFEQMVRKQEKEEQQRLLRIGQVRQRTDELALEYETARKQKRQALRRWTYSSREEIQENDQKMVQILKEKDQLLSELEMLRMFPDEKEKLRGSLQSIGAE